MKYTVYQELTGEILRIITCHDPEKCIIQGETFVEGAADPVAQKVVNGVITDKTAEEIKDYEYSFTENSNPPIDTSLNDEELNSVIFEHFCQKVDPAQWRIKNYQLLRKKFYPPMGEILDAEVKMRSKKEDDKIKSKEQLEAYDAACWAVKERFPKE